MSFSRKRLSAAERATATGFRAGPQGRPPIPPVFRPLSHYHPTQRAFWIDKRRFIVVPAGRRSGKTTIAVARAVRDALRPRPWDDPRFGFGAPTRAQAKRIFWPRLKGGIPSHWIADISESELRITLVNGAILQVAGMEAAERYEGLPWDGWHLDEYADMRAEVVPAHLRPALMDRKGWLQLTGVPEGRNHFFDTFNDYRGRDECSAYTWKSAEIIPHGYTPEEWAAEIEQMRRDLDERSFRQELEASFEEATGRIYYAFDQTQNVCDFALPADIGTEKRPWIGGMDFNVHPLCAVWGWEERRKGPDGKFEAHVFVWDSMHLPSSNTYEGAQHIRKACERDLRWGPFFMHPDPTGRRRATSSPAGVTDHVILQRAGFRVFSQHAPPARRDRYNAMNTMLCAGDGRRRLWIRPTKENKILIKNLEGLLYKEGSSEPDKQKCVDMDHDTDGLGYWVSHRHGLRYQAGQFSMFAQEHRSEMPPVKATVQGVRLGF